MGLFQLDLYGELMARLFFFVCMWIFILKPLKPSHLEKKLYFAIVIMFIAAKWVVIDLSKPSYEEEKYFFLGIGIFLNTAGYFTLFLFLQSILNIKSLRRN
jgi:hypothetical protein